MNYEYTSQVVINTVRGLGQIHVLELQYCVPDFCDIHREGLLLDNFLSPTYIFWVNLSVSKEKYVCGCLITQRFHIFL